MAFDYRHVWTADLRRLHPIVHRVNRDRLYKVEGRGFSERQHRTRCGSQVVDVERKRTGDVGADPYEYEFLGVLLYGGHATAMGARFCRNCWPKAVT